MHAINEIVSSQCKMSEPKIQSNVLEPKCVLELKLPVAFAFVAMCMLDWLASLNRLKAINWMHEHNRIREMTTALWYSMRTLNAVIDIWLFTEYFCYLKMGFSNNIENCIEQYENSKLIKRKAQSQTGEHKRKRKIRQTHRHALVQCFWLWIELESIELTKRNLHFLCNSFPFQFLLDILYRSVWLAVERTVHVCIQNI